MSLKTNPREGVLVWQKPVHGWVTFNVDAAVNEIRKSSAFGCLIRDDKGSFLAGCGGHLMHSIDPKIAEAMAFREALSWLKKRGVSNVFIELDSLSVVQAVQSPKQDISYFGSIIDDCSTILKDLGSFMIYFVRRSANVAVHLIARKTTSLTDCKEWFSIPPFLIDVLAFDIQ